MVTTERTNEQSVDPWASLLVSIDQADFCNFFTFLAFDKSHLTNEEKEMSPNWEDINARIFVQIFCVVSKRAIWRISNCIVKQDPKKQEKFDIRKKIGFGYVQILDIVTRAYGHFVRISRYLYRQLG